MDSLLHLNNSYIIPRLKPIEMFDLIAYTLARFPSIKVLKISTPVNGSLVYDDIIIKVQDHIEFSIDPNDIVNKTIKWLVDFLHEKITNSDMYNNKAMTEEIAKWWITWYTQIDWGRSR